MKSSKFNPRKKLIAVQCYINDMTEDTSDSDDAKILSVKKVHQRIKKITIINLKEEK